MAILVMIVLITYLAIPVLINDIGAPKLIDADTKQLVFQKKLNPSFLIGIGAAIIISILYVLLQTGQSTPSTRTRSMPEIWADVPYSDLIKLELKDIYGMTFDSSTMIPTNDPNIYLVRIPDLKNPSGVRYLAVDVMEDWKKRRTKSPIVAFVNDPVSWVFAETKLVKNKQGISNYIKQGERLGISPEETRRRIALQQALEAEKTARIQPDEGGYNE